MLSVALQHQSLVFRNWLLSTCTRRPASLIFGWYSNEGAVSWQARAWLWSLTSDVDWGSEATRDCACTTSRVVVCIQ